MATLGEKRIRTDFNPSNNDDVSTLKANCAFIINSMHPCMEDADNKEVRRLVALGHTAIEEAAMWYVKALTAKDVE